MTLFLIGLTGNMIILRVDARQKRAEFSCLHTAHKRRI